MEYAQITMDEYLGLKKDIHESIGKIVKNFVRIGKILYQIEQSEAYKLDGYKTLAEFAKSEYDMKAGGVSRFVGVYRKYCNDEGLKQGYEDYTYAQLVEMLNLSEEDEELIRPNTSREDIRDLKRFNREGRNDIHALESWKKPEEGEHAKYLREMLVILFQKKERESDFNAICAGLKAGDMPVSFSEYVNPGGNKTIRNGRTMVFLFENEIRMKVWGENAPAVFSYEQLKELFAEQFQTVLEEESGWWEKQFEPEKTEIAPAQKEKTPDSVQEEKVPETGTEKSVQEENGTVIREEQMQEPEKEEPKQPERKAELIREQSDSETKASDQRTEAEEQQIPGQDTILNHPEYLPKDYQTDVQVDGEPVEAEVEPTYLQRKEECLSLISTIQGYVTLEKYEEAYQSAGQLLEHLEVMKC